MLSKLHIQNLAVVADVSLSFEPGLNALTGSTGAGKSLILGALNFLLGERVGAQAIRAGEDKAIVEGVFALGGRALDLEGSAVMGGEVMGGELRLRREVHRNGRSYAFIDGRPATMKQVQEISQQIIEPHGQNEQLRLKFPENHVVYLDKFARNEALLDGYQGAAELFRAGDRALREFDTRMALVREKKELLEHRLVEIQRLRVSAGEKQKLEESIRVLEHANEVFESLAEVQNVLYEDEASAVSLVSRAKNRVGRLQGLDAKLDAFVRELEEAEIALKETAANVRAYLDGLQFEPQDLEKKQSRLGVLIDLERRYRMPMDEILAESERWKSELGLIEFEDEERAKLETARKERLGELRKAALGLSVSRKKAASEFDVRMTRELEELMMAGARFRTDISYEEDPSSDLVVDKMHVRIQNHGIDHVEFYVQTNPGELEGPLAEVASSGELSRIALALKEVVTTAREGSLLVFDEVDVGVGADLGEMISRRLHRLGQSYQIVCITHMPQIAAKAGHHLVVGKRTVKGRTFTEVVEVDGDDRLKEIARMLGGREGSEKRLALAREMLQKDKGKLSPQVRP